MHHKLCKTLSQARRQQQSRASWYQDQKKAKQHASTTLARANKSATATPEAA